MMRFAEIAQVIVALSVILVWTVRLDVVVAEFREYDLPDLVRNLVGATKIALGTLLITGIWYPRLVLVPAVVMAFLMFCAQIAHFKVRHRVTKYMPSLALLMLCVFVAGVHAGFLPR